MPFPNDRLTTYGTETPVQPNDLNTLQDAVIVGAHGVKTLHIPAAAARWSSGPAFGDSAMLYAHLNSQANPIIFPVPLHEGDRIREVRLQVNKSSSGAVTIVANLVEVDNSVAPYGTAVTNIDTDSSAANAPGEFEMQMAAVDHVIGEGCSIYVNFSSAGSPPNDGVFQVEIDYDHPV